MINTNVSQNEIVFFDIETVRGAESLMKMPKDSFKAWLALNLKQKEGLDDILLFKRDAALYPEFGKIVCISLGLFDKEGVFKVKAYSGNIEEKILDEFTQAIGKASAHKKFYCGHNIKRFDIPFMIRRSVILGVPLPLCFGIYGHKPWDLNHLLDTMEIWQSGSYLGSSSLQSICAALGIGNPKEQISGDMISTIYYNLTDKDRFNKIGDYCNNDVVSCAKVFLRFSKREVNFDVSYIL